MTTRMEIITIRSEANAIFELVQATIQPQNLPAYNPKATSPRILLMDARDSLQWAADRLDDAIQAAADRDGLA